MMKFLILLLAWPLLSFAQNDEALMQDLAEAAQLTGVDSASLQGLSLPEKKSDYQLAKAEGEPTVADVAVPAAAIAGSAATESTVLTADEVLPAKDPAGEKSAKAIGTTAKDVEVDETAPLKLPPVIAKSDGSEIPFMRLIFFALGGVSICVGVFMYLKKKRKSPALRAGDIKILSQTFLGPKKSLAVIRVAGESVLIGITDQNINLLKTLSLLDEEIPQETPQKFNALIKQGAMDDLLEDEEDHYEYNGLQNAVVSKIKSLKDIGSR